MKRFFYIISVLILLLILQEYGQSGNSSLPSEIKDHGEMILIPAGEFLMGSSEEEILKTNSGKSPDYFYGEIPKHRVYLQDYYIDKYEVTNKQFQEFIKAGGYEKYEYWTEEGWNWKEKNAYQEPKWWLSGQNHSGPGNPGYPVIGVSWYEAHAYALWAGKRLPTEAEWEKAARGLNGNVYPWGMEWDAKRCVSTGKDIQTVGSIPDGTSPYGIMDMSGNVWEWCTDWHNDEYYLSSPSKNPTGPKSGTYKVLRGGCSGNSDPLYFRCANRYKGEINYWDAYTGFRCVKDI